MQKPYQSDTKLTLDFPTYLRYDKKDRAFPGGNFLSFFAGEMRLLCLPRQTGSYHFPLTIRPPTKMEEKIAVKIKRVIQIGLSTHSHDHEINPVTFSTAKIKTKATIGSILDRWNFFSVRITEPPWISICWAEYTIPQTERLPLICQNFPFFLRTYVPAMYACTQRLTRNAQYRGMQSKRQGTPQWWYPAFTCSCLPFCVLPPQNLL